jgi:hypothetical protein
MIGRRGLIAAGAGIIASPSANAALPVPRSGVLSYRLMRHGDPIGTHVITFHNDGGVLRVDIAVDVLVKLGPIPFVRYTHRAQEAWRGDQLVGAVGRTDKNGKQLQMGAEWRNDGLAVQGSGTSPYIAPPNAFTTTYWNHRMLFGPMIGTQDGGLVRPKVTQLPTDPILLASGDKIPVTAYKLSGDLNLELWYDSSNTWAGMRFTADDGSLISYERL